MYKEHDIVVLRRDIPDLNLIEGDVGAVVGVYRAGGYEVEFSAPEGDTLAVVTVGEEDIRSREAHEILHVRPLARAIG